MFGINMNDGYIILMMFWLKSKSQGSPDVTSGLWLSTVSSHYYSSDSEEESKSCSQAECWKWGAIKAHFMDQTVMRSQLCPSILPQNPELHMSLVSTINSNVSPKEVVTSQDTAGKIHHQSCSRSSLT